MVRSFVFCLQVFRLQRRYRREELFSVLVMWIFTDLRRGALFDNFSAVHHNDFIAHVLHHGEVVSDEEIGEFELLLQILQEIDDLA